MGNSYLPTTIIPDRSIQNQVYSTIQISQSLSQYWDIDHNLTLNLSIGQKVREVLIIKTGKAKNEIYLCHELFDFFRLPDRQIKLLALYSKIDNTLYLGPVIALLTEISTTEKKIKFNSMEAFCQELHFGLANSGGLFYIFNIKDFSEVNIMGYHYNNEIWEKTTLPHPTIIYNRIHSRKLESSTHFNNLKKLLNKLEIPIFNDCFLSKELVHNILHNEEHMQVFLPETVRLSEDSLSNLLKKHSTLFLKPINGSQGRNIIRITRNTDSLVVDLSSGKDKGVGKTFTDNSILYQWLRPIFHSGNYICQEGISFKQYLNKSLDFRVLCHKNYQNNWNVTSVVARIAAEKQFVSNIARGGEVIKPIKVLTNLFGRNTALQQLALIQELAIETATIIEQNQLGMIAELGIDIGVDDKGEIWIIEVNSKPSKRYEDHTMKIRPSAKALLEYCTAISFQRMKAKEDKE